jgi:putative ABC transport system substrate-binding protein
MVHNGTLAPLRDISWPRLEEWLPMRRREFIAVLGGAAAWPLAARAQRPGMPVIGYLSVGAPIGHLLGVFKQSLAETGFVEGRNVAIETPSADGRYDRLPALAADLVRRQVAVIVAITASPALAAKAATATIPIVFNIADDPVELGLVASLPRPGGNATGVSFLFSDLVAKHLGLLRELLPTAARFGMLVNPQSANAEILTKKATAAAAATGVEIIVVRAGDPRAIEDAFATLARQRVAALMVGADGYFYRRRVQLTTLAARLGLPTVFTTREFAEAGGLMSYGTSLPEAFRMTGLYTGRILKGAKPADLPVVQSTKFDFVINFPTAKALGLDVPPMLLARADEVIE